ARGEDAEREAPEDQREDDEPREVDADLEAEHRAEPEVAHLASPFAGCASAGRAAHGTGTGPDARAPRRLRRPAAPAGPPASSGQAAFQPLRTARRGRAAEPPPRGPCRTGTRPPRLQTRPAPCCSGRA